MKLNPQHLTLHEVLSGRLFRIPDYQRAYAWEARHRADLFADIRLVAKSKNDHFMATIVALAQSTKRRIGADEYKIVGLVDGQQRLTTFVVLFKAIEKALDRGNPAEVKVSNEIRELLVKGDDHSLVLLQTNHASADIFSNYLRDGAIQAERGATAAEQNVLDAMRECEQFVKEWKASNSLIDLIGLLRHSLSFIYHELVEEALVYRVFEVLNSRGLDVKWIDKLKSQLMAMIYERGGEVRAEALGEMKAHWEDIYRKLGLRTDLGDEALRFAATWSVVTAPNRILSQEAAARRLADTAGTSLPSIAKVAMDLKRVVGAVHQLDSNARLRAVTKVVHVRFLAVAILLRGFPAATEHRLLRLWEKVSFRLFGIWQADTRHKVGDYVRLGYDALAGQASPEKIAAGIVEIGKTHPIERVLREVEWTECYHGWAEELRYLLFRYEEHLADQAGEKLDSHQWNKIWTVEPSKSIEHIQPQSSRLRYIHHLGNLTMLPPGVNSTLRDKAPKEKAATYRKSGLRATSTVGRLIAKRGWTEREVRLRTEELLKFVREEWGD